MTTKNKTVDISTFFGISFAFCLVATAVYIGGTLSGFLDLPSALIVILGTISVTIASFSFSEVMHTPGVIRRTVFYKSENPSYSAMKAVEVADIAKKKGILELDKHQSLIKFNSYFYDGIRMLIDSIEAEEVERILEHEISSMAIRHTKCIGILKKAAETSPAMGLIGTLVGLVQMLSHLDDPTKIGPAMAIALLTTFYGATLSYMVFSPLASKLERNTKDELMMAKICLLAIRSIARKESPRKLEMLINSELPPLKRISFFHDKIAKIIEKKTS